VPRVSIKSGFPDSAGREEELVEYICDMPGCANVATHVLGRIPSLGFFSVACAEHVVPDYEQRG
jgi:hypothetical protein